jgi:hypothetical protein
VARYLGADDPAAPLDIRQPRTALEHAAAITPVHPALLPLVKRLVQDWVARSRPYAKAHDLRGASALGLTFLHCYPPDRRHWEERLLGQVPYLVPAGGPAEADAYQTGHPYVAVLTQFAYAAPLGALESLPKWFHQLNREKKAGNRPIHDPAAWPELRLLHERPDDSEDSEHLFQAACHAGVIGPLPGDAARLVLRKKCYPWIARLFAPELRQAEWKTASFFHRQLGSPGFVAFLESAFADGTTLGEAARRLAREHDSRRVASELVEFGVVEADAAGQRYRVLCPPDFPAAPAELFRVTTPLRGLGRAELIAALHGNDDLYNVVFWGVADALDLGAVSANDLPPFLAEYVRAL